MVGKQGRAEVATFVGSASQNGGVGLTVPTAKAGDLAILHSLSQSVAGGAAGGAHWVFSDYVLGAFTFGLKQLEQADLGATLTSPGSLPSLLLIYRGPITAVLRRAVYVESGFVPVPGSGPGFDKDRNHLGLVGLSQSAGQSLAATFTSGPSGWDARQTALKSGTTGPTGTPSFYLTGVDSLPPDESYVDGTTVGVTAAGASPTGTAAAQHHFGFLELRA